MEQTQMQKILLDIKDKVISMETKIDTYNNYREKTDQAHFKAQENEKDIKEIQGNLKWTWRTIAGVLIVTLINAILNLN